MKLFFAVMFVVLLLIAGCAQQSETKTIEKTTEKMEKKGTGATATETEDTNDAEEGKKTTNEMEKPKIDTTGKEVKTFTALVTHTGYTPNKFTVNEGDIVRILANTAPGQDWHGHGFAIDAYTINTVVRSADKDNPVVIEFIADKVGTFSIYCKTCNDDTESWKQRTNSKHPDIRATLEVLAK